MKSIPLPPQLESQAIYDYLLTPICRISVASTALLIAFVSRKCLCMGSSHKHSTGSIRHPCNPIWWTAVMGFLDGTFTKPMVMADGTVIQPTGKEYHLPMATLGHWNKKGVMGEEYLFWDNATLMQQIGVGK